MIGSRDPRRHQAGALQGWLSPLLSLVLALGLLVGPGSTGSSEALGLPGRSPRQSNAAALPLATSTPSHLQEVAPPLAVQQLQEALAGREPRVEILEPADETLLPPGPWTLRLRVHDWPLVDGGALGLGPHLVVQVDDDQPLPLTGTELTMASLAPGSHRITVYAARPWGEAAKNPGAWRQIRLHRAAANPLALPAPGLAQLIAVSPAATAAAEPLLLDWLLLDAPLQNLRDDDARWRLRVTINGDGFVLDRQTPLWLTGWQQGRNAIRLELLDGQGEPLTPPYNSLVREVEFAASTAPDRWQRGPLSARELAILLGEAESEPPAGSSAPDATPPLNPALPLAGERGGQGLAATPSQAASEPPTAAAGSTGSAAIAEPNTRTEATGPRDDPDHPPGVEPPADHPWHEEPDRAGDPEPASTPGQQPDGPKPAEGLDSLKTAARPGTADGPSPSLPPSAPTLQGSQSSGATDTPDIPAEPMPLTPASAPAVQAPLTSRPALPAAASVAVPVTPDLLVPGTDATDAGSPQPGAAPRPAPLPAPQPSPSSSPDRSAQSASGPATIPAESLRLRPRSSIEGPAREQVNADGTLIQPPRRGPLAGLRERLLP